MLDLSHGTTGRYALVISWPADARLLTTKACDHVLLCPLCLNQFLPGTSRCNHYSAGHVFLVSYIEVDLHTHSRANVRQLRWFVVETQGSLLFGKQYHLLTRGAADDDLVRFD